MTASTTRDRFSTVVCGAAGTGASALPPPAKRPRGHGSITVEGSSYYANYRELDDAGKPGAQRRKAFGTEDEAHVYLNEWFAEKTRRRKAAASNATKPAPKPLAQTAAGHRTFAQAIVGWRASKLSTVNDATWRNYDPALDRLKKYLGDEKLDELAPEHFEHYRRYCLAGIDPTAETDDEAVVPPLGATTVNQHLDRAKAVMTWALRRKHRTVPGNPLDEVEKASNDNPHRPTVINEAEIARLIAAAPDFDRVTFVLLGHLALRISEALAIGINAWVPYEDDKHGPGFKVPVEQQVKESRPGYKVKLVKVLKSHYSYRELFASDLLAAEREAQLARLTGHPNPHKLLTPASNGAPPRYRNWLRDVWWPTVKRAGLDGRGLTPHGLRHSRLSLMAASGKVTIGDLSKFAGHESVAFTLRKYGDHYSSPSVRPSAYLTG